MATFVSLRSTNGKDTVWVNADLVAFVRPTVAGEPGNSFIWCEGAGLFVEERTPDIINRLGQ